MARACVFFSIALYRFNVRREELYDGVEAVLCDDGDGRYDDMSGQCVVEERELAIDGGQLARALVDAVDTRVLHKDERVGGQWRDAAGGKVPVHGGVIDVGPTQYVARCVANGAAGGSARGGNEAIGRHVKDARGNVDGLGFATLERGVTGWRSHAAPA